MVAELLLCVGVVQIEAGSAVVTPQPTDSTGEFENRSDEAEELFYSSLFRVYVTSIWS